MKKVLAAVAGTTLALVGCTTAAPTMTPAPSRAGTASVPAGGAPLRLQHGPQGLSAPEEASIVETIDRPGNVTLVFTAPTGAELAAYYRRALPGLGFTVTADARNSLLFEDGHWQGGFTASGSYSALTLRTDWG